MMRLLIAAILFLSFSASAGPDEPAKANTPAKTDAAKAETAKAGQSPASEDEDEAESEAEENSEKSSARHATDGSSGSCLVSEEAVRDLDEREKKLSERETALNQQETELKTLQQAVKEQIAQLDDAKKQVQSMKQQEITKREDQVKKLIDAFESMSPKSAALVIAKVDEDLAVVALGRLSTAKAGKILAAMDPTKSSRLSELMAMGMTSPNNKGGTGDANQREPASSKR